MILSFKEQFIQPILDGTKIHTIRTDKGKRWTIGKKIHFATGTRTKEYNCFMEAECVGLQKISIYWRGNKHYPAGVFIGGTSLNLDEIDRLARNDGFSHIDNFLTWFNDDFKGIIIHWTDLLY